MKITESEVRYVADLANLQLSETEVAKLSHDLEQILTHIDALREINTEGVEPMTQVLYEFSDTATLRPDEERAPLPREETLANAPSAGSGYFKVPKVIER